MVQLEIHKSTHLQIILLFSAYKKKIGFTGPLLIEPKPKEPSKHQYDYGKN